MGTDEGEGQNGRKITTYFRGGGEDGRGSQETHFLGLDLDVYHPLEDTGPEICFEEVEYGLQALCG